MVKNAIHFAIASSLILFSTTTFAMTQNENQNTNTTKNTNQQTNTDTANNKLTTTTSQQTATTQTVNVNDKKIVKQVKAKLAADKITSDLKLNITSQNGVVVLVGQVNADAEASRAVELAQSVPGVRDTNTEQLTVKESQQPLTDTYITAKVKGSLVREKLFGDKDISVSGITVETTNGTVYLIGTVDNNEQATTATKIAKEVSGVKAVESKLVVNPTNKNATTTDANNQTAKTNSKKNKTE